MVEIEVTTQQEPEAIKRTAPDGGWAWVVCFGCFMMFVLNDGIGFAFGIVFYELLDYYKGTKAETVWIFSLNLSVCFLIGPFVAALISMYGCRTVAATGSVITCASYLISAYTPSLHFLYFSLGVLLGIGEGMVYQATIVCVSENFEKRRSFATGITVMGSGLGTFLFSPVITWLIETYAWRGAIWIQSALVLNCVACSLLYRPLQQTQTTNTEQCKTLLSDLKTVAPTFRRGETNIDESEESSDKLVIPSVESDGEVADTNTIDEFKAAMRSNTYRNNGPKQALYKSFKESFSPALFKHKSFTLFLISTFFYMTGYYIPFVYLPVKSRDTGVDEYRAAWILSCLGISTMVGRVVFGYLSDKKWVNRLILYNTSLVICGIASCIVPVLNSFTGLLLYAVVFGMFSGASIPLTSVLIVDFVGIANLSPAFGISNCVAGVSTLIGPPIAGWLYDKSESYDGSFLFAGITILFAGTMLFVIPCLDRFWKN